MSSDTIQFRSLARAESSPPSDITLRRWWKNVQENMSESVPSGLPGKKHVSAFGSSAIHAGEGLLIGGFYAMLHVELPQGLDAAGRYPLDLLGGVVAGLASAAMAHDSTTSDYLRTASACSFNTFAFRKGYAFAAERAKAAGKTVGGTFAGEGVSVRSIGGGDDADRDPLLTELRELENKI